VAVPSPAESPSRGRARRIAISLIGLALALAVAFAARAFRPVAPLPVYGTIPTFRLVDQQGAPYTESAMLGHTTVVDFVFTRCTSSCPRLTARMAELQHRLEAAKSGVRLVSFSVDPENDTPPVLSRYAEQVHADTGRWSFVTGPVDDVSRAVVLGFKMSAAKVATGANDYEVTHGDWFVLVDAKGQIRGYYPTSEPGDFEVLVRDTLRLERTGR
jgi:protein SCO1/2